jgi:glycosyltransferase involved in cell wall biosynthesis
VGKARARYLDSAGTRNRAPLTTRDALATVPRLTATPDALELSVVIPCLDEADTIETCVRKAVATMGEHGVRGEVVVADNGSRDGSQALAEAAGARVVAVAERGYGQALMTGIAAAHGRFVIMGDADDSYDFREIPRLLAALRDGNDLVQGCRLPAGGGRVMPGAMPWLHRHFGNPALSWMARWWFRVPIHDVYCGMRGFSREFQQSLDQRCTGMEFATEMIVKASLHGARIAEVPITLHPDGRKAHPPHLRTFQDGWRTLRLFLLISPRWLFFAPGLVMIAAGLCGYALALPNVTFGHVGFDAHTLLFATAAIIMGYQSVLFAIFTKIFAISERLLPVDPRVGRFLTLATLERSLVAGVLSLACGLSFLGVALDTWWRRGFGTLDYSHTMRWVVPGVMLACLGFQTVLSSFFISILGMRRRG